MLRLMSALDQLCSDINQTLLDIYTVTVEIYMDTRHIKMQIVLVNAIISQMSHSYFMLCCLCDYLCVLSIVTVIAVHDLCII